MAPGKHKKKGKQPSIRSPSPSPTSSAVTNVVNSKPRLKIHGPKPPATPELQPESEDPISAPEPGLELEDPSQSDDSIRITPAPEFKISRKEVKNAVIGLLGPGLYEDGVESSEAEPEEMEVDSQIILTSSEEEKTPSTKGPKKRSRKAESEEESDEDEDLDEDDEMESDEGESTSEILNSGANSRCCRFSLFCAVFGPVRRRQLESHRPVRHYMDRICDPSC
jgi:hypothetical protein